MGARETRLHFKRHGGYVRGQAVAAGVRAAGLRAVLFEEFGGRDADPEEAYLPEVEEAEIYIGILGRRYGKPLKSRYSATYAEYLQAERHGLRIAVWTSGEADREGHQQALLDEVRTFHFAPQRQVENRMRARDAQELAPWCNLGQVVFRATKVEDRGDAITVKACVRDDGVGSRSDARR